METRAQEIRSKINRDVKISVIPGHFATNHSHVNYYVDITRVKTSLTMAKQAAKSLATNYTNTIVDTIICLEGTEMLGAFLAQALADSGINAGNDVSVITPELNSNNQMIFRDNTQNKIWGKQVLLLVSSVSTGKTISRSFDCFQYYNGHVVAIAAIFSAVKVFKEVDIKALFSPDDLADYHTYSSEQCSMCKGGQKVDAIINSYGYSKI